jgi:hypothetical protein
MLGEDFITLDNFQKKSRWSASRGFAKHPERRI